MWIEEVKEELVNMTNWVTIIKKENPRFGAFFKENDITDFIKEAVRKEKEDILEYGTIREQVEKLTDKYGISRDASHLIRMSHLGPTPIIDINSYNRFLRQRIEERQKRKLKERNRHPTRKKGQRRR